MQKVIYKQYKQRKREAIEAAVRKVASMQAHMVARQNKIADAYKIARSAPSVSIATYTYPNGDVYEGDWRDGKPHGRGKMTYPNGDVYEGDWLHGKANGIGKYTYRDGRVYEGGFCDGNSHGKGKHTYPDGGVYEGDWLNGVVYEGDWRDGKLETRNDDKCNGTRNRKERARERSSARTRHSEGDDDDIGWV